MGLADDLRSLRDQALADLDSAHDYYTDTKAAGRIVRATIDAGHAFSIRSTVTGTITSQADLAAKAGSYVAGQLNEATFQQFLSIFEGFFFDLLRLWLTAYPQSLGGKKIDFKSVLDASDKDAITLMVVNKELNEILYERPTAWFAYLEDKVKLGCPSQDEVQRIAEAKASRDVLAHGRGVVGKAYESKAGALARHEEGDRIGIPSRYHRETWRLLRKVVTDLADAAIAKAPS
jgi:hypothetical protein